MSEDEFWKDDAAAIAERDQRVATGRRYSRLSLAELERELPGNGPRFADPDPRAANRISLLFMFATVVAVLSGVAWIRNTWEPKPSGLEHFPALTVQQEREFAELTEESKRLGLLLKIVGNDKWADAYVLPPFHGTTVDVKSNLVKVWYGATFGLPKNADEKSRTLTIKDGLTGKSLRSFDPAFRGMEWR